MRVVAGNLRGRALASPKSAAIRPTADRLRESLFNILLHAYGDLVAGARVLDLFAGTGAVGLELLSRGAAAVTLVESDPAVQKVLRANVAAVGLPGATVRAGRAESVTLDARFDPFDVVFVDPPYALDVDPLLASVGDYACEVLVIERATRSADPSWPAGFLPPVARRYGDSTLWYGWRS